MKKSIYFLLLFAALYSCKKEENPVTGETPKSNCFLAEQTLQDTFQTKYEWDNMNRLIRSVNLNVFTKDSFEITYQYKGNSVELSNGSIYYLNASGNADSGNVLVRVGPNTQPGKLYFTYNAQQQVTKRLLLISLGFGELELETDFTWKDGDIVAQLQTTTAPGFSSENYTVLVPHQTLLNESGNWQNKALFAGVAPKHVVEKEIRDYNGSEPEEYLYSYEQNAGKITRRFTVLYSDTIEKLDYSWSCR
ncbi:MAG: hypothetical protein L6Q78_01770 [Bacteroidia bacterium]|nr:hypothetical protein [Bacteroidia bacterium]